MINLLKNEFTKIFRKKGIYIVLIIMLLFVILINCIQKYSYNKDGYMEDKNYTEENLRNSKDQLSMLDVNSDADRSTYISVATSIKVYELTLKYGENSWQGQIINEILYDTIFNMTYNTYAKDKSNDDFALYEAKYNEIIKKFDEGNWRYFVEIRLSDTNTQIATLETQKSKTTDKMEITSLEKNIKSLALTKETLEYRLKSNISYDRSYLDDAINEYSSLGTQLINYDSKDETYDSKFEYNQVKSSFEISKYIFTHKEDANKSNDTRGMLKDIFSNFELFIIVTITIIVGAIVADEFNKGTIKQLLIKPHTRFQILLAKYITALSMILIAFTALVIMQLIVGGILFGFGSLSIPAVVYNLSSNKIATYNIFYYLLLLFINKLPLFILMTTFIFFLGVITVNSAVAITVGLIGYIMSGLINSMATYYNVEILRFFPTLNWDFTMYMFGNIPQNQNINLTLSIIMCISYFITLIMPTFIIFIKKNIKNI